MSPERRIARNTLFMLCGQAGQALCVLVLWLLIARLLTPEAIGQYSLAVSLSAVFALVTKVGYEHLAIREVARHREQAPSYLGRILTLKGALALVGYMLLVVTVLAVGYGRGKASLIIVVGATSFITTLVIALEWCFQAFERMEYQGGLKLLRGLSVLTLGAVVLLLGGGIMGVALVQLVTAGSFFAIIYYVVIRRFARPEWRMDWPAMGAMTKKAVPFGLGIFATVLLFNMDTIMLSHMQGDVATGLYNLAYRLVDGLKLMPIAFASALYPSLSNAFKHEREALAPLVVRSWYFMVLLAVPAAVGTTMLSDRLIVFFFGARYEAAGPVLALIVWAGALLFVFSVLSTTFAAIDRQPTGAALVFFGTGINVGLNLVFIPRWGAWGASLALVVAMFVISALGFVLIGRVLSISQWGSPARYASIATATALMAAGVWMVRGANLGVVIAVGVLIYGVIIFATRGLRWTDLRALMRTASG